MNLETLIEQEPTYYSPIKNENGIYVDQYPDKNDFRIQNGFICTCGTRKEHSIMNNSMSFRQHIKTKTHQTWLMKKNESNPNYYQECKRLEHYIVQQNDYIYFLENQVNQLKKECQMSISMSMDIDI